MNYPINLSGRSLVALILAALAGAEITAFTWTVFIATENAVRVGQGLFEALIVVLVTPFMFVLWGTVTLIIPSAAIGAFIFLAISFLTTCRLTPSPQSYPVAGAIAGVAQFALGYGLIFFVGNKVPLWLSWGLGLIIINSSSFLEFLTAGFATAIGGYISGIVFVKVAAESYSGAFAKKSEA